MYYPLKQTDPIYRINCSLYRPIIWAFTWDDVVSFVARNRSQDYEIRRVSPEQDLIEKGAAIILGIKDKKEKGDYSIEEFGGWLEEGTPIEKKRTWEKRLLDLKEKVRANYPESKDWVDKWYTNILNECKAEGITEKAEEAISDHLENDYNNHNIHYMISSGFVWEESPEGYSYWDKIWTKYQEREYAEDKKGE